MASATQPRSWAEDVNSYRSTRGCKAFSTTADMAEPVKRIPRTVLMPLANPRHPQYSFAEAPYQPNSRDGSLQRCHRHGALSMNQLLQQHMPRLAASRGCPAPSQPGMLCTGWGDVTLLQDGVAGPHRAQCELPSGRMRVKDPSQEDMFGMLQCKDTGRSDAWFGHASIDPSQGKKTVPPPFDSKGRKDLFALLNQSVPGKPSDDNWMGNILIDPAHGKRATDGPEARMGRKNLFPVIQQVTLGLLTSGAFLALLH